MASGVTAASVWYNAASSRVEWRTTIEGGVEVQLHIYVDTMRLAVVRRAPGGQWEQGWVS